MRPLVAPGVPGLFSAVPLRAKTLSCWPNPVKTVCIFGQFPREVARTCSPGGQPPARPNSAGTPCSEKTLTGKAGLLKFVGVDLHKSLRGCNDGAPSRGLERFLEEGGNSLVPRVQFAHPQPFAKFLAAPFLENSSGEQFCVRKKGAGPRPCFLCIDESRLCTCRPSGSGKSSGQSGARNFC